MTPNCAPKDSMDSFSTFAGLLIVGLTRVAYVVGVKRHHTRHEVDKTNNDQETRPLLVSATDIPSATLWPLKRKRACLACTLSYIVLTVFVSWKTIEQCQGPVLRDLRFMAGRGGMVALALLVLVRLTIPNAPAAPLDVQADAVALIIIPYVLKLFNTPTADFPARHFLDIVVAPALGALCLFNAR